MTDTTTACDTTNGATLAKPPKLETSRDEGDGVDEHRVALVNAALQGALVVVLFERDGKRGAASGRVGLIDEARNTVIVIANATAHASMQLSAVTQVKRLRQGKGRAA